MRKMQRPAYWPVFEGFQFSVNSAVSVDTTKVDIIMDMVAVVVVVVVEIEGELLVEFEGSVRGGRAIAIMQMK